LDQIGQAEHQFFACQTNLFDSILKKEARVPALLELRAVKKSFGALSALKNVSFSLEPGRVLALVGDNGAGKSTLVKILAGVHGVTHGEVLIEDAAHIFSSPADARAAGIETVYQDLALIEDLDVADNVYLGREVTRGGAIGRWLGLLDRPAMRRETAQVLAQLHIKIPSPQAEIARMSGGQRQAVAIGRAITWGRKLLILDEPTAALGVDETEQVLRMIEDLRDRGMTFLVVSHNMRDVHRIADDIVVLRQGVHVATLEKHATSPQEIVEYITGAKAAQPGLGLGS
jgi:ABC-type sugar transport system ATPase subunit